MPPCSWPAVLHSAEALYPVRVYGHTVFERFYFYVMQHRFVSGCFGFYHIYSYLCIYIPRREGIFHVETRKKVVR